MIGVNRGVIACGFIVKATNACHPGESGVVTMSFQVTLNSEVIGITGSLHSLVEPEAVGSHRVPEPGQKSDQDAGWQRCQIHIGDPMWIY